MTHELERVGNETQLMLGQAIKAFNEDPDTDAMLAAAQMTAEELDRLPRHAIDARLSATGSTPHELAASLNGFIWVIGGDGEGPRTKLSPLFGDFLTELGAAVTSAESDNAMVRVDCDGIYLEIDDGKVKTAPAGRIKMEADLM